MCGFSEETVRAICDPVNGLPAEDKWLPSLAEIKVACEARRPTVEVPEQHVRVRPINRDKDHWAAEFSPGVQLTGQEVDRAWQRWLKKTAKDRIAPKPNFCPRPHAEVAGEADHWTDDPPAPLSPEAFETFRRSPRAAPPKPEPQPTASMAEEWGD